MGEVTKRMVVKELYRPFTEYDPDREELLQEYIVNAKEAAKLNSQIEKLKAAQRPFLKASEEALADLTKGKLALIECEEIIMWDENVVVLKRADTGEIVSEREISESDRQIELLDN
jgi:hypothetical protein